MTVSKVYRNQTEVTMIRKLTWSLGLVALLMVGSVGAGEGKMRRKLREIRLDRLKFEDAPVRVVFEYLKQQSCLKDPEGEGVNFVVILNPKDAKKTITIK